jgi:hypothetical protein
MRDQTERSKVILSLINLVGRYYPL